MKSSFRQLRFPGLVLLGMLFFAAGFLSVSVQADETYDHLKWRKERLRHGGKSFAEHRKLLLADIEPRTRLERLPALLTFARHGLGREAADTILEMMCEYEYSYVRGPEMDDVDEDGAEAKKSDEELADEDLVDECLDIIDKIGPTVAVPVLRQYLDEDYRGACVFALEALAEFGTVARDAVPEVLELTKNKNPQIVADAYLALGIIGSGDAKLLKPLLQGVEHKDSKVRAAALEQVGYFVGRSEPEEVTPAILEAMGDPDSRVCCAAVRAARSARIDGKALPALIKIIQRDDAEAQDAAFSYLNLLGPSARDAVPTLIGILKDWPTSKKTRQMFVQYRRVDAGGNGESIPVPQPEPIPSPTPKKMPASGLPTDVPPPLTPIPVKKEAPPAPQKAAALKNNKNPTGKMVRESVPFDEFLQAVNTLGRIGPDAREAVPILRQILDSAGEAHQEAIRAALEAIERPLPESKQPAAQPQPPADPDDDDVQ